MYRLAQSRKILRVTEEFAKPVGRRSSLLFQRIVRLSLLDPSIDMTTTRRTWKCMCGSFEGQVTGDAALACWCYCGMCRKQTGAPMQLGVFPELEVLQGEDVLLKYEGSGGVFRNSCSKCGSFCYKVFGNGAMVAPLGALEGAEAVKPTCCIFVKHRGDQEVFTPDLPQHDEFP